ncbi:hypothetical protein NXV69_13260 [Bacteroides ovatus]|uniref:hypothetical protein n=1 Tax=Bacteroides ovatus TaxID=28116 RepID=UPI002165E8E9|nr:hypothetical protein [Bacteroides ovatus]MCS2930554.1 hypothetical protein [Bacteroides ovatus]
MKMTFIAGGISHTHIKILIRLPTISQDELEGLNISTVRQFLTNYTYDFSFS